MAEPITDERAREVYTMATQWVWWPDAEQPPSIVHARNALRAEWDAWIAAHDAQVRAEALREAATGARSTRFQIHHGEHVTYADTFEAGVRSVQQMLFAAANRAEADRIAATNHTDGDS